MQFKISNSEREYFKFVDLGGLRKLRLVETQIIHNLASELNSKHLDRVQILYYQKLVCYLFNSNLVKNLSKKNTETQKQKLRYQNCGKNISKIMALHFQKTDLI